MGHSVCREFKTFKNCSAEVSVAVTTQKIKVINVRAEEIKLKGRKLLAAN